MLTRRLMAFHFNMSCCVMDLQSHRFLSYFEPPQAAELCQLAILQTFAPQAVIFEESEIPDCLYLVLEGDVELTG